MGDSQGAGDVGLEDFHRLLARQTHKATLEIHAGDVKKHVKAHLGDVNDGEHCLKICGIGEVAGVDAHFHAELACQALAHSFQAVGIDVGEEQGVAAPGALRRQHPAQAACGARDQRNHAPGLRA